MDNEREEAVEILLCIADLYENHNAAMQTDFEAVDLTRDNRLAREAWRDVTLDGTTMAEDALEAAALVAEGWNVGDPVPS